MQTVEKFNIYDMDKTRLPTRHIYSVSKYYGFIGGLSFEKARTLRLMMKSKTLRYSRGKIIPPNFRSFINNVRGNEVQKSLQMIAHHFWLDGNKLRIRNLKPKSREEIDEILYCAENIIKHPTMINENFEAKFQLPLDTKIGNEFFVNAEWNAEIQEDGGFKISYGQMLPILSEESCQLNEFLNKSPY